MSDKVAGVFVEPELGVDLAHGGRVRVHVFPCLGVTFVKVLKDKKKRMVKTSFKEFLNLLESFVVVAKVILRFDKMSGHASLQWMVLNISVVSEL